MLSRVINSLTIFSFTMLTMQCSEESITMWQEMNNQRQSLAEMLHAKQMFLEWEFSGEIFEEGLPLRDAERIARQRLQARTRQVHPEEIGKLAKNISENRIIKVDGKIEIYMSVKKIVIIIRSSAPISGSKQDPAAWLPTKVWLEFDKDYSINIDESLKILQVYKTPSHGIYHPVPFGITCLYPFSPIELILLTSAPIFPLYGASLSDWRVRGSNKSTIVSTLHRSDRLGRKVTVECVGYRVLVNTITATVMFGTRQVRTRILKINRYHHKWKCLPASLTCEAQDNRGTARLRLHLKRVDEKAHPPSIPTGIHVNDYRLMPYEKINTPSDSYVHYLWTGRLPTEEELKQMAYQQGNLIPPAAPRRRFSPLLFAPAIVFFALAAYFYFRNRRR